MTIKFTQSPDGTLWLDVLDSEGDTMVEFKTEKLTSEQLTTLGQLVISDSEAAVVEFWRNKIRIPHMRS